MVTPVCGEDGPPGPSNGAVTVGADISLVSEAGGEEDSAVEVVGEADWEDDVALVVNCTEVAPVVGVVDSPGPSSEFVADGADVSVVSGAGSEPLVVVGGIVACEEGAKSVVDGTAVPLLCESGDEAGLDGVAVIDGIEVSLVCKAGEDTGPDPLGCCVSDGTDVVPYSELVGEEGPSGFCGA